MGKEKDWSGITIVGLILFFTPVLLWLLILADIDPGKRAYTFGKDYTETITHIQRRRIECTSDTCIEIRDTAQVSELWRVYDLCKNCPETQDMKHRTNQDNQFLVSVEHATDSSGMRTGGSLSREKGTGTR